MGFLKGLGQFLGAATGEVMGGAVKIVGEVTGSKLVEEIGEGVRKACYATGEIVGNAASGAWDIGAGILTQDGKQFEEGFDQLGSAVGTTAKAIGSTVCNVVENGASVIEGFVTYDSEQLSRGAKGLIKVAAVGALAIGVVDLVDGVDGVETDMLADGEAVSVENPDTHGVDPHWVSEYDRADGTHVEGYFRDGDGDTSVNSGQGWTQHNPDFIYKG